MEIKKNISLLPYNSFGINVQAASLYEIDSVKTLLEVLNTFSETEKENLLVLGGGSNSLFTKDVSGPVLKINIPGITELSRDEEFVYVQAGAGVGWHEFVLFCLEKDFGGVENLSLIPGSVGASPMQNIGAYGVEIKDVFYKLSAVRIKDGEEVEFTKDDCSFGYRESIFKHKCKGEFIITSVTFKLTLQHKLHTDYGAIQEELKKMNVITPAIKDISNAVIQIRQSKLPDPKEIGNAGSFFKNPEIDESIFKPLKISFPQMPAYVLGDGRYKLAAAWLIEQCGWKGHREKDAGCHDKQALVLVNYGFATGEEILALSDAIISSVQEKFGITLQREVNVY